MISQQSKDIITATLPAVRENAMQITSTFYPLMFERYPQVKAYFNESHQRAGTQRQAWPMPLSPTPPISIDWRFLATRFH